jgi:MFS family permease
MNLLLPPDPLTRRQRSIAIALAVVCALSRFASMARSLWDWDETLLCLGMRAYDVARHHPHPPGFPVFIGFAKVVRLVIHDDFRSLQAVSLIAGMLLFPAMLMLGRELRLRFEAAAAAAVLCAFLPNVWFFGGAAFSDVASLTLIVFAVAFLIRGCRDANAYITGSLLLGLAVGIRPQNFLIGLAPGLLATWYRARVSWRDVFFAALVGTVIVAVAFGGAMVATGSSTQYLSAVKAHSEYISRVDSFRSAERPPLWRLFDRFFIKQYQSPALSIVLSLFAFGGAVVAARSRDRRLGLLALAFVPFALLAWLMLDRYSISRFSIGYCPLFVILAAYGMDAFARQIGKPAVLPGIAALLVAAFIVYAFPSFAVVRNELSPPVLAMNAIRNNLTARDQLLVAFGMTPFVEYFLPYQPYLRVLDERAMPLSLELPPRRKSWIVTELDWTTPRGLMFRREKGPLWNIARRHYFNVALAPIVDVPQFVSGWYRPEREGTDEWRWMAQHSVTRLPPAEGKQALRLTFDVPDELMGNPPVVTIAVNGSIVARFRAPEAHLSRDYYVQPAAHGAVNVLELAVDKSLNPARQHLGDDPRELGLLVRFLSWGRG